MRVKLSELMRMAVLQTNVLTSVAGRGNQSRVACAVRVLFNGQSPQPYVRSFLHLLVHRKSNKAQPQHITQFQLINE